MKEKRSPLLPLINSSETWRTPTFTCAREANRIVFVTAILVAGQAHHQLSRRGLLACTAGRRECRIVPGGEGARHLRFLVTKTRPEFPCAGVMTKDPATGSRQAFVRLR